MTIPAISPPTHGISVIIPAFNEEQGITSVLPALVEALNASQRPFEVLVIDDGSTDRTAEIATQLSGRLGVKVLSHRTNKGYGASLKTGIRAAQYGLIVMMDSDGQHNPADVLHLVDMARDYDMVVGTRGRGSHSPTLRRPGKWLLQVTANYLAGVKIPDLNSGLRVFSRELAVRFMHILPNGFSFTTTLTLACLKENFRIGWMPITVRPRSGKSSVKPIRDGYNTFILILRTIVLFDPLKVFLPPSLLLGLFGILFSIYGIIRYNSFPETGVLVITAAIILFFLGILADSISALRLGMRS
ncbi:MAG: glycosyltransferase family 2 protein [Anaerolineales bacterium]|jgi:glycosyltransferase involved in cell wall biosynthesis|nr:glycosyltransferase family 2 protein [Anaerolineales bacterium]